MWARLRLKSWLSLMSPPPVCFSQSEPSWVEHVVKKADFSLHWLSVSSLIPEVREKAYWWLKGLEHNIGVLSTEWILRENNPLCSLLFYFIFDSSHSLPFASSVSTYTPDNTNPVPALIAQLQMRSFWASRRHFFPVAVVKSRKMTVSLLLSFFLGLVTVHQYLWSR